METLITVWQGLDWSVLTDTLMNLLPAVVCITLHEYCHGLAALALGDTTARDAGRLTLNPLRSLDLMGLLMMAVFHFGWAKPVPISLNRLKNPKRDFALTALAGPVSNLLLTVLCLFLYGVLYLPLFRSGAGHYALELLYRIAALSTSLAVFNLIPIPPLDGSRVVSALLGDRAYAALLRAERWSRLLLIALLFSNVLSKPLSAVIETLFSRLFTVAEWGYSLGKELFL